MQLSPKLNDAGSDLVSWLVLAHRAAKDVDLTPAALALAAKLAREVAADLTKAQRALLPKKPVPATPEVIRVVRRAKAHHGKLMLDARSGQQLEKALGDDPMVPRR